MTKSEENLVRWSEDVEFRIESLEKKLATWTEGVATWTEEMEKRIEHLLGAVSAHTESFRLLHDRILKLEPRKLFAADGLSSACPMCGGLATRLTASGPFWCNACQRDA